RRAGLLHGGCATVRTRASAAERAAASGSALLPGAATAGTLAADPALLGARCRLSTESARVRIAAGTEEPATVLAASRAVATLRRLRLRVRRTVVAVGAVDTRSGADRVVTHVQRPAAATGAHAVSARPRRPHG